MSGLLLARSTLVKLLNQVTCCRTLKGRETTRAHTLRGSRGHLEYTVGASSSCWPRVSRLDSLSGSRGRGGRRDRTLDHFPYFLKYLFSTLLKHIVVCLFRTRSSLSSVVSKAAKGQAARYFAEEQIKVTGQVPEEERR